MRKVLLAAAVGLAMAVPTTSVADTPCSGEVESSSGAPGDLWLSVTGPPERAVAVGIHYVGGDGNPLIARRDGDVWNTIRVPTEPGARMIQFQDATTSGGRVWVVGSFRNDRPQAGWVTGNTWHWTHPIDPGQEEDEFLGVATTPDGTVWAVGKHQVGADYQPLIELFDGANWSVIDTPHVDGSAVLKDVAVAPDGTIYAVGWRVLPGGNTRPLIVHSTDAGWSVDAARGAGLLSGIAILPDGSPIAVGWRPSDDGDRFLTMRPDTIWHPVDDGSAPAGRLTAIAVGESTVAVGTRFEDGVPTPIVVRFQGSWSPVDVTGGPAPETGGDQLLGITGEPGSFLAVGIRDATEAFASLAVGGECVA
jgi:hypothetical protein